ncbi:hypothetical protein G4B88_029604 [Cannabis sativa]|uniref:Uncharacterized protein n=1 Tax=Cannabis sativa TaxID=3483 RepID=A0A7J6FWR7_CANSA|nr:hypothetical protein G4B88_029604 [Cannabis sativa]
MRSKGIEKREENEIERMRAIPEIVGAWGLDCCCRGLSNSASSNIVVLIQYLSSLGINFLAKIKFKCMAMYVNNPFASLTLLYSHDNTADFGQMYHIFTELSLHLVKEERLGSLTSDKEIIELRIVSLVKLFHVVH